MRNHHKEQMSQETGIGATFEVIHAKIAFTFLETLLNGPSQRCSFMKFGNRGGFWGV